MVDMRNDWALTPLRIIRPIITEPKIENRHNATISTMIRCPGKKRRLINSGCIFESDLLLFIVIYQDKNQLLRIDIVR